MKDALQSLSQAALHAAVCLTAIVLGSIQASAFPIITNVVETGGDNEATDTIVAQWTGVTWNTTIANEPTLNTPVGTPFTVPVFSNGVPTFVDRNHRYSDASATLPIPGYLVGGEYIMSGNDNRDNNPGYQLDISVSEPAIIFMLVDNRLNEGANGDPPNFAQGIDPISWTTHMTWLGSNAYKPLLNGLNRTTNVTWPDEVGIDEGSDGTINNWYSIYWKQVPAGTTSIYQADNAGRNMYGVVVGRPVGPLPPGNLQAASMNARVSLTWSASTAAIGYIVKRSDVSGGPYSPIVTNTATGYLDTNVVNFQTYYYVVSAVGFFAEGSNSVQVAATPKLAPESLVAIGGTNQVSLSWIALSGASSYTVKRADASGGPYSNLVAGLATTSYVDSGLPSGRRFYYTVSAALTAGGESANADEAPALTAPNTPANFGLELFGSTGAKLRWTTADVVDPTNLIERSSDGVNFVTIGASTGAARIYLDTGLARSATYSYRIRATNSGGFSSYTSVANLTTPVYGININFANNTNADGGTTNLAPTPAGYVQDIGEMFGPRGGLNYGWDVDNTVNGRWRQSLQSSDLRYDTFNHMQRPAGTSETWEIEVTNGLYIVHLVAGDPTATDSIYQFNVEGFLTPTFVPTTGNWWAEFTNTVKVTDGRLTIASGPAANNNKIDYADIYPTVDTAPPALLSAARDSSCAGDSLTVVFNEVLEASSAIEAANYRVVNLTAGVSIAVLAGTPVLREDGRTVALNTSTPLTNGALYQIIATNIQDIALNTSVQSSAPVTLQGALVPASVGADWLLAAEAENPDSITPRVWRGAERTWVPTTTRAGYSGTGAMRALPNTEGDPRPATASECASLDFCVHFPESDTYPRTYYIWVRGGADGSADDSCYAGSDGLLTQNMNQGWIVSGFTWSGVDANQLRVTVDIPSGGFHSIQVFLREDGFYCDKIVLTTDVNYTPASVNSGLGPVASSREATMLPTIQFVPGTLSYAGGTFSANLQTIAGLTNVVEYKNSLGATTWAELTSFIGDGSVRPITDPGPLPAGRFYRARVIVP